MPTQARAAILLGPHQPLRIETVTLADPGPDEVQIRMLATGLCHSDLHAMDGWITQSFPVVMGHEGCGEIEAIGEGVTDFAVGDRVIPYLVPDCGACAYCRSGRTNLCEQFMVRRAADRSRFSWNGEPVHAFQQLGTFAERIVVPADMVAKIDSAARPDHACCIGCGVTTGVGAAMITAGTTAGSSVAVIGCGGVGLSAVQGARLAGATTIIAIDRHPGKEDVARKVGATHFLEAVPGLDLVAAVGAIVPLGVDFALDCVGDAALARQALEMTNMAWGKAVCVGVLRAGESVETLPINLMLGRQWTGSLMGGAKRGDIARFVDLYRAGDLLLDDLVTHRLTLDEINRGFDLMRSGEAVRSVVTFG